MKLNENLLRVGAAVALGAYWKKQQGIVKGAVAEYSFEQRNLLKWSQDLDNAAWAKPAGLAVTPNAAIAPDGTMTADKLVGTLNTDCINQALTVRPGQFVFSVYLRSDVPQITTLRFGDLANSIDVNVTADWQRFVLPVEFVAASNQTAYVYSGQRGVAPGEVYAWGAMVNQRRNVTRNLLTMNQANGGEDGTATGFNLNNPGTVFTSSNEQAHSGSRSIKSVCDGTLGAQGVYVTYVPCRASRLHTAEAYVIGSGNLSITITELDSSGGIIGFTPFDFVGDPGQWQKVSVSRQFGPNAINVRLGVRTALGVGQNVVFYVDDLMIHEGDPIPFELPAQAEALWYEPTTDLQRLLDVSRPLVNLVPAGKEKFEAWTIFAGAAVTITQNQAVAEWSTDKATRIQTAGGADFLKYYTGHSTPPALGQPCSSMVKIKNIGANTVKVAANLPGFPSVHVAAGEIKSVVLTGVGNGAGYLQLRFEALNIADNLDFIVFEPQMTLGNPRPYMLPTYDGQLGSTFGGDINDPYYTGWGLQFGADDYVKLPFVLDATADFTIGVLAEVPAAIPGGWEMIVSFGNNSLANPVAYIARVPVSGNLLACITNDAGATPSPTIVQADIVPGMRYLVLKRKSGNFYLKDIGSGKSDFRAVPASPITLNVGTIGAMGKAVYSMNYPHLISYACFYPFATSDSQDSHNYRYIQRKMGQRGAYVA